MAEGSPIIVEKGNYVYERDGIVVRVIAPRDLTIADAGPALLEALAHVRPAGQAA